MNLPFEILGFDHIHFFVGNAKQSAKYYENLFGFETIAYRGLETESRDVVSYVLKQNNIYFVLSSPLSPESPMNNELRLHGDGVKEVAFLVNDSKSAWNYAVKQGAESAREPEVLKDGNGEVVVSAIKVYGDTIHSFVERRNYKGIFIPGFISYKSKVKSESVGLKIVDHAVSNHSEGNMEKVVKWYEKVLSFHRFWTVDDKDISTEYSALRSVVVASPNERVKLPINEPAPGKKKSQIQEYLDYYYGPGIQHIAIITDNIIDTVEKMSARGVEFLETPRTYYDTLRDRVKGFDEEIETLAKLGILLDEDENGYMLQIFTKPVQDRPTLFYEIIQRKGSQSFGKGNFKALFESIEREQAQRGNL
jgi:4-hydroxyphenylpyruvate dioxygenase